jgi:hypothetical protein
MNHQTIKLLVKQILDHPTPRPWGLQGFGMLRLYLSPEIRLHVWDNRFAVPGVSTIHNHPWAFESYIVAGVVRQRRYVETPAGEPFNVSVILAGPGGGLKSQPQSINLHPKTLEIYNEGDTYTQDADEIHWSMPEDGAVTLVTRRFVKADRDHARVFWPQGQEWVSAEPRPATPQEINEITGYALQKWFSMPDERLSSAASASALSIDASIGNV